MTRDSPIQLMIFQRTIFRFLIKAMVITVYSIFFAVQIFFRFASGSSIITSKVAHSTECVSKIKLVTKNPKTGSHQVSFRLNKHFHPKFLPSGIFSLYSLSIDFIDEEKACCYAVAFISSPFCFSGRLRGPPAMNGNS